MARGWESKYVEEQQQTHGGGMSKESVKQAAVLLAKQDVTRQRQGLEMQRELILSQRTSNPGRRQALEAALEQVNGQLAELG